MNKQRGEILTGIIILAGLLIVASSFFFGTKSQQKIEIINTSENKEPQLGAQILIVPQGGTGESEFASSTIVSANGTDKLTGTSTLTFTSFHATSTTATSTIRAGLIIGNTETTNTSILTGVTSCSGSNALMTKSTGEVVCQLVTGAGSVDDVQAAYDASAVDAQITTADAKDLIYFLTDTATDPNFIIVSSPDGQGQFQIGTANGSATTTNGVWENYGRIGIATTTPGTGLAVQATSTLLGYDTYIYGQLTLPFLVATSGPSLFLGDIGSTANRVPNIYAKILDTTTLLVNNYAQGDLTISRDLFVNGADINLGTGLATTTLTSASSLLGIASVTPGALLGVAGGEIIKGAATIEGNTRTTSLYATSTIGSGTTTPYAQFAIDLAGGLANRTTPTFAVGDNGTSSQFFVIDGTSGNIGFGTTSPWGKISIETNYMSHNSGMTNDPSFVISSKGTSSAALIITPDMNHIGFGTTSPWGSFAIETNNRTNMTGMEGQPSFVVSSQGTATPAFFIGNNNNFIGISTTSPYAQFSMEILPGGNKTAFAISDQGTSSMFFAVNNSGNVSIGAIKAPSRLTVLDNSANNIILNRNDRGTFSGSGVDLGTIAFKGTLDPDNGYTKAGARITAISAAAQSGSVDDTHLAFFTKTALGPGSNNVEGMRLTSTGFLGIATDTPSVKLEVNGSAYLAGNIRADGTVKFPGIAGGIAGDTDACLDATTNQLTDSGGAGCVVSSIRFKENIEPIPYGLDDVLKLDPIKYNYKPELDSSPIKGKKHVGLIAEEVEKIIPELISYETDGVTPRSLSYEELTAVLVKAIQEQNKKIDLLEQKLNSGICFNE